MSAATSSLSLTKQSSSATIQRQAKEKYFIALSNKSQAMRFQHKLVIDGSDVSPQTLNSLVFQNLRALQTSPDGGTPDSHSEIDEPSNNLNIPRGSTMFLISKNQSPTNIMTHTISRANSLTLDDQSTSEEAQIAETYLSRRRGTGPSAFYIPRVPSVILRPPHCEINIVLKETTTSIIFDLASTSVQRETEEAEQVEEDNEYYEYITTGKGKNRKTAHAEVQTMTLFKKCASTNFPRRDRRNGTCYTNYWMLYDALLAEENRVDLGRVKSVTASHSRCSFAMESEEEDSKEPQSLDDTFTQIAASNEFRNSVARMERVLASNIYNNEQLRFKGLLQLSPLRLDVEFKYSLTHMWTFTCEAVKDRCVTSMCWNHVNTNLLAVGYGRYKYNEKKSGFVCCWSVKNPVQPERKYQFDVPVTSVEFSRDHPNLLAVGFTNGTVYLLDVSALDPSVIAASQRVTSPSYEAVWQVRWHREDATFEEQIMTAGQDGRISKYRMNKEFTCSQLMRINRMEGLVKGIEQPRKCQAHELPVSQHPAVLLIRPVPTDNSVYYAGTDEGCVHRCSVNNVDQHLDLFVAHNGPIYSFQFSPFSNHIFLTCGADWSIRVWAEGVFEPLLVFTASMEALQGATWCPTNSTVIASITGSNIELWDIRRKTFVPASVTASPTAGHYTTVQYTASGENLLAGDVNGCVHVYACCDMPFSPFYQEETLIEAIMKNLITKQSLAEKLKKMGRPFANYKF